VRTNRARIVGVSSCRKVEENECCAGGSCQAVKEATAAMFAGVCAAEGVRLCMEDRGAWRKAVIVLCKTRGVGGVAGGSR